MIRNRKKVSHVRFRMFGVGSLLFRTNDTNCVGKKHAKHVQNVTCKTQPKENTCTSTNVETNIQETNTPPPQPPGPPAAINTSKIC
jgi:hypothetical protein